MAPKRKTVDELKSDREPKRVHFAIPPASVGLPPAMQQANPHVRRFLTAPSSNDPTLRYDGVAEIREAYNLPSNVAIHQPSTEDPVHIMAPYINTDARGRRLLCPSPEMFPLERLRSRSPERRVAQHMLRDLNFEAPTKQDIQASNFVWRHLAEHKQPEDPFKLGQKFRELTTHDKTVRDLSTVYEAWKKAKARGQGENAHAPLAKSNTLIEADVARYKEAHEIALHQYVQQHRVIAEDPYTRKSIHVSPGVPPDKLLQQLRTDYEAGRRFPGGKFEDDGTKLASPDLALLFNSQTLALKRNMFDNGFAYSGWYPPATPVGEYVGSEMEVHFEVGGHRLPLASQRVKEDDYKYVAADEVDWEEVNANGGLGDLVIVDDDTAKKLRTAKGSTIAGGEDQTEASRKQAPWTDRRQAFDDLNHGGRH